MHKIEKKKRNYGLELLKVISMLMIVSHHAIQHAGYYDYFLLDQKFTMNNFLSYIFDFLGGQIGVYCFIIITSWFLVDSKKYNFKRIMNLILDCIIINMIIYIFIKYILNIPIPESMFNYIKFTPFNDHYWFLNAYINFYLLYPFINKAISSLNNQNHKKLCIIVSILNLASNFIIKYSCGSFLFDFITVYIITSYLKNNKNNYFEKNYKKLIKCFVIFWIVLICAKVLINNNVYNNIYFRINNRNFIPLFISICLFYYFKNININKNIITSLSKYTLGVYLIHENCAINYLSNENGLFSILWTNTFKLVKYYTTNHYFIIFIIDVILVFITATIIYAIYNYITEKILYSIKWYNKICDNISLWYNKIYEETGDMSEKK